MTGVERIAAERARQIAKGYTPERDASKPPGLFAREAALYAEFARDELEGQGPRPRRFSPDGWPDDCCEWDPRDPVTALTKAGALIAAEIDRLAADV